MNLERLEERQLLSTLGVAAPAASQIEQPDVQSVDFGPLTTPTSFPSYTYTPSQMRTAYGISSISGQGQGMTIAIVDAYSQPDIRSDLATFSADYGLPQMDGVGSDPKLSILVPPGQSTPSYNSGWGMEISLDVEWAHAIAPHANIDLVTCQDDSADSLYAAEVDGAPYKSGDGYAKTLPGVVVVSNSYGFNEFAGETEYDSVFTTPGNNVAFTFSTGDYGAPPQYPASSPNVVAVGGSSLYTLTLKGAYGSEIGWTLGSDTSIGYPTAASSGGPSLYESTPAYQSSNGVNFGSRATPDVSMDADPNTGVPILDTPLGGWFPAGGTSLSAPMWAGLIALGDQARGSAGALSSTGVLNAVYGAYNSSAYTTDFHDITVGYNGYSAGPGYDLVTGIGTPKGPAIVNLLAGASPAGINAHGLRNTGISVGQTNLSVSAEQFAPIASLPLILGSIDTSTERTSLLISVDTGRSIPAATTPSSQISVGVIPAGPISAFVTKLYNPATKKLGSGSLLSSS
jgi:subtilase family serine protease